MMDEKRCERCPKMTEDILCDDCAHDQLLEDMDNAADRAEDNSVPYRDD